MDSAAIAYNKWALLTPNDADAWYNLGGAYFNSGRYAQAKKAWERSLQINPNNNDVKRNLQLITPQMLGQAPVSVMPQKQPIQNR
jgi:tetratricopeptide (TPR) repeat protein